MAKSLRERLRLDCLAQAVRKGVRVRTDRGFPRGSWIVRVYVGNGAGYIYGATLWAGHRVQGGDGDLYRARQWSAGVTRNAGRVPYVSH